ncbi:MAG: hypothetical protein M0Z31_12635 [Clostridia bacterium]|nr:hypothetical protein [Clostridia bacterium]
MPTQPAVIIITSKAQKKGKGGKLKLVSPQVTTPAKKPKIKVVTPVKTSPVDLPALTNQVSNHPPIVKQKSPEKEKKWRGKLADCRKKCKEMEESLDQLDETLTRLENLVNPRGSKEGSGKAKANNSTDESNFLADLLSIPVVSDLVVNLLTNVAK